jgi:hypothetical protein
MKYLITESQLDKFIFKYIDLKRFIQIEKNNRIYFVNSEGDEFAQIRYDKEDGWCVINFDLIKEISSFFSLERSDSEQVIGKWVENTLQMKVTNTIIDTRKFQFVVENTLQMKVTDTVSPFAGHQKQLRIPYK